MQPFTTVAVLAGAEAFLAVLFSILFHRLSRIYRRADLRFWTLGWALFVAHLPGFVVDAVAASAGLEPADPLRALSIIYYNATSNLAVAFLAIGAIAFVAQRDPPKKLVVRALAASAAIALAIGLAFLTRLVPAGATEIVREGIRALIAAGVAIGVAFHVREEGSHGRIGATLTKIGLAGFGLSQIHYAVAAATPRTEVSWSVAYFAVADMIVWMLLGVGVITWLLEQERGKVVLATQELQRQDSRFETIINGVQDSIFILDRTGAVVYSGHRESDITGFTSADVIGTSMDWHVHPDDLERVRHAFHDMIGNGAPSKSITCRIRIKEGGWVTMECVARNHLDTPGIGGLLVTARDVTERQRLETQLHHAQRMESIGRLAGGVAHDFNNLLTVIAGNADLGRVGLRPGMQGEAELTEIASAAQQGAALTRQLLAFARHQVVEPRTVELNDLVSGLDNMLRRLIGEHIALSIVRLAAPGYVRVDPGQLAQVLVNLAANARDAMPDGGELHIEVGRHGVGTRGQAGLGGGAATLPSGAYLTITVRDTGIGISSRDREHLFEPFFTTKEKGLGTGLGLATSYGIVTQAGGTIVAESEPGLGTAFVVYLPEVRPITEPGSVAAQSHPASGWEMVLVVEDEADVRRLAVRSLTVHGYHVVEAPDGEAALAVFGARANEIKCVVTDVVMPRINGVALARELRARRPDLPVLFTSGYADEMPTEQDFAGPTEFLDKPYTPATLALRVRALLDRVAKTAGKQLSRPN